MKSRWFASQILVLSLVASAQAQVTVDGSIAGDSYGAALAVQAVQTQFGDNFSEWNAAYGTIDAGRLCITLTGNVEGNFNKLDIFIDSQAGGENTLSGMPGNDNTGNMAGLTFDAGFDADYLLVCRRGGSQFDVDFGELGTANFSSYIDVFGGFTEGSGSTGTGLNASAIEVGYDNSNVAGVGGGCAAADQVAAEAVQTGVEICIDLADIGNPAGVVRIMSLQNNQDHNFAANQFLASLPAPQCNLGGDGAGNFTGGETFDMNTFAGDQFFTVSNGPVAVCGDGVLDAGEDCDDGNTADGDCCSSACLFETMGSSCDDAIFCNGADTCDGAGVCNSAGDPCAGGGECNQTCNEGAGDCFDSAGTACGSGAVTVCDNADTCNGSGSCLNNYESASTVCRPASGGCDVAESCDGSGNCPTDAGITGAIDDDGCCPPGATDQTDNDCVPVVTPSVPTVSNWGMALLVLTFVAGLVVWVGRRGNVASS